MAVWWSSLGKLVYCLQMAPEKRGLELGELSKLVKSQPPYLCDQVCCQERQGQSEEIRHRRVPPGTIREDSKVDKGNRLSKGRVKQLGP